MTNEEERALLAQLEDSAQILLEQAGAEDAVSIRNVDLPEGKRQILHVSSYSMYATNWQVSASNPAVGTQPHIHLKGAPSPSSDVEQGYLRFVDPVDLRRPTYSAKSKRIDIWLDYRSMPQVLVQLGHANRHLWIGHFKGGHIYGDLHSGD